MRCLTFYQALSHPCAPELGKEQSILSNTDRLVRNFQELLLGWFRGCANLMFPAWEGAGAGERRDRSFGRVAGSGERVLSLRKRSREKGGGGDLQVQGPHPPPFSTLTSSVSRRGISMEPRDMARSEGERAFGPAAPQLVLLASGSSRG